MNLEPQTNQKLFSVGFDFNSEKYNFDFNMAKRISKHYKTDHHELIISAKDMLDNVEKTIYHLDEPVSNTTQVATYLLSKFAKKQSRRYFRRRWGEMNCLVVMIDID